MKKEIAVLLHNVRSAHNVGSIFRTADAAGVSRMFLSGYTPTPTDRFGRAQKEIAKTALGAEKFLPWEYQKSPAAIIAWLRKTGWRIVGVEQDPRAVPYMELRARDKTLYIFGNEVKGVPKTLLKKCDSIVEIPMRGKKESLNVSVAAGVILFSVR
jgi:23S rRNA (guanosine2251-2'-O)-methyltransferase